MAVETGISGVGQVALTVNDLERSVAFYRDVVGLPLLFRAPPALVCFPVGGTRLMLTRPEGGFTPGGSTVLYFTVADIQAAAAALKANGATLEREPHLVAQLEDRDVWMAFFRDPDNHLLGLLHERQRA